MMNSLLPANDNCPDWIAPGSSRAVISVAVRRGHAPTIRDGVCDAARRCGQLSIVELRSQPTGHNVVAI